MIVSCPHSTDAHIVGLVTPARAFPPHRWLRLQDCSSDDVFSCVLLESSRGDGLSVFVGAIDQLAPSTSGQSEVKKEVNLHSEEEWGVAEKIEGTFEELTRQVEW